MTRKHQKTQYTIRAIPSEIDQSLRERAEREGKSLNQAALEALRRGLGMSPSDVPANDLGQFVGTWVEDPAFDDAIAEFERIDDNQWR